jgi:hypothetical protein
MKKIIQIGVMNLIIMLLTVHASGQDNLIQNGDASDGLNHWNITQSGGDGWSTGWGAFLTSFYWCEKEQFIDLVSEGFTTDSLDQAPGIYVADNYVNRDAGPDKYRLHVQLLDNNNNVIENFDTGEIDCSGSWQTASNIFENYGAGVRKIRFIHGGESDEFWSGHFGAKMDNAKVKVFGPPELTVNNYTAEIPASGSVTISSGSIIESVQPDIPEINVVDTTISQLTFNSTGVFNINISAEDEAGQVASQNAEVTILAGESPQLTTTDTTVELNISSGSRTISPEYVVDNITDNSEITDTTLSQNSFSATGSYNIDVTVEDMAGYTTTQSATVNVETGEKPQLTVQDISLSLNENGMAEITPADVITSASDNFQVDSKTVQPGTFSIADAGHTIPVEVKTYDLAGNVAIDTSMVTVNLGSASVVYVDSTATGANDGSSWSDAYTKLQDALSTATAGDAIYVAEGTYFPDEGGSATADDRSATFSIPDSVAIYGGFSGTESMPGERDIEANPTVLSGEITQNGDLSDNSYHVVMLDQISQNTVIDGFTVTLGNAEGTDVDRGGGIKIYGKNSASNPILKNCIIKNNEGGYGGGMFVNGRNGQSNPTIENCTFTNNTATSDAGAIYFYGIEGGEASPVITNCTFKNNSAGGVAGAVNFRGENGESSPTITNSSFVNNEATGNGGALYISNKNNGYSASVFTNVDFLNNYSEANGGVIYEDVDNTGSGTVQYSNCIFSGNEAGVDGGVIRRYAADNANYEGAYINCLFTGNYAGDDAGVFYEIVEDGSTTKDSLINCTFTGNRAYDEMGVAYIKGDGATADVYFSNSILWSNEEPNRQDVRPHLNGQAFYENCIIGNSGGSSNWNSDFGTDNGNNLDTVPQFVSPVDPANAPTTNGDFRLNTGLPEKSPAVDAGLNGVNPLDKDLADKQRVIYGTIDMGVYEHKDTIAPALTTMDTSVVLDNNEQASISADKVISSANDNWSVADSSLSKSTFNCSDVGEVTIQVTVKDHLDSTTTKPATVNVKDTSKPSYTVNNTTVSLNANGEASVTAGDLISSASDNCSITDTTLSQSNFSSSDLGDISVDVTVEDASGNTTTKTATVTVEDNAKPSLTVSNTTVALDANGEASITDGDVVSSASDNNSLVDTTLSQNTFTCSDVGNVAVEVTVEDASENTASKTATVTVEDNLKPVLETTDVDVDLGENGKASISADEVVNSASDNCSISDTTVSQTSFTQEDAGDVTVEVTVQDINGNSVTKDAVVTVNEATAINKPADAGINIYPNPTDGKVNISFTGKPAKRIRVVDMTGRTVLQKSNVDKKETLDLSEFNDGIYIFRIRTEKGTVGAKVIKN